MRKGKCNLNKQKRNEYISSANLKYEDSPGITSLISLSER
jgi:hypothetical protein